LALHTLQDMVSSTSFMGRVVACAAKEPDIPDPEAWVEEKKWDIVTQPGWEGDWQYASETSAANPNVNPDIGARTDVISDEKIISGVQAVKALP
jgi:hypothetical protein